MINQLNFCMTMTTASWLESDLPSTSTSLIMSCSSLSVGFWPSDLIIVPNSVELIVPSPFLSNRPKASRNSAAHHCNKSRVIWEQTESLLDSIRQVPTAICNYMLSLRVSTPIFFSQPKLSGTPTNTKSLGGPHKCTCQMAFKSA